MLIVDDEPGALTALGALLPEAGFEVETASDGAMALSASDRFAPDILVTDLDMPVLNGAELGAKLRGQWPDLPVLLMTGHDGGHAQVAAALTASRTSYIGKPVDIDELVRKIHRALDDSMSPSGHMLPCSREPHRADR